MKTTIRSITAFVTVIVLVPAVGQLHDLSVRDGLSGLVLLGCLGFLLWRAGRDSGHHHGW